MRKSAAVVLVAALAALAVATQCCSAARPLLRVGERAEVDLSEIFANEDVFGLAERHEEARRKLQQVEEEVPGFISAPVNAVAGAVCQAIPRDMYEGMFGMPWWAPMGVAQGICAGSITSSVLGGSL
ncbi:hypothetical protein HOP50_12g67120 [Chloropicon primus]|uniref:Uncharacterized protein n=1 Tax=Chloropicon primus TaxID=1764295 RepID=A0A5B8MWX2_9CHLO|nr:hypothetical protein A3770_12p66930 [Chloropicon primus]UPR03383.1 hypothetical protein HOP50_12g67120 [Chloropicon primus]|eukprot:QDZ24175.1 hypothetical protein A3770_12p66930 [Chloropicon primus]